MFTESVFYARIQLIGNVTDTDTENGAEMLEELGKVCDQLKVAGTFAPHTEI